ncbi:hypothetical protein B566_EDAN017189 [Ephemera danica]|nr:hypothetical protein B566_EDAN017189 [Ephemera danica]
MSQGNQLNHRNSDSEDGEAASSNDFVIVARSDVLQSAYERLKSYPNQWESTQHTKLELAQDGLYYTGPVPFMVACAFCAITFDVQEKTQQEIRNEHMNKRPQCNLAGNVPLGDVSNYRFEKNRLITFLSINWTAPVDPYDLAKFGFYWTGSADVGRYASDQAYTEHMKWNPHCQFILGRNVGNVPIGEEENGLGVDHVAVHSDAIISQQQSMCKHPSYGSEASRLQTYDNWPLSLPQKPIDLAKAGFYYTGRGDRVICFQCGGGLKDWGKGDDPWVEHAVWFQTCAHLLNVKGQAYVDAVQTKVRTQRDQVLIVHTQENVCLGGVLENETQNASGSPQNDGTEELSEAMAGMSSTLRDLRTCKVCFQKELGIVFLPCGHMATCPDCAPQLQSCPICRGTAISLSFFNWQARCSSVRFAQIHNSVTSTVGSFYS